MTTAEVCGAQLKEQHGGFFLLVSFFFPPKAGTVSLGSADASAFLVFTQLLSKPTVRWCPYLFTSEAAPVPGEKFVPSAHLAAQGWPRGLSDVPQSS